MVAVKKGVVVCLLWIIASHAWAEEDLTLINAQQEDEIINLAYTQMRASIEELERKIEECEALAKSTTLDPALFQSLSLTKQEARTALGYFSSYTREKCEGKELWARIPTEFAQFKHIEKEYKGKNIIKTESYLEIACCMGIRSHFETKWRYLKLAPEIRAKLERIPELQTPFNAITTAKKMGLFD